MGGRRGWNVVGSCFAGAVVFVRAVACDERSCVHAMDYVGERGASLSCAEGERRREKEGRQSGFENRVTAARSLAVQDGTVSMSYVSYTRTVQPAQPDASSPRCLSPSSSHSSPSPLQSMHRVYQRSLHLPSSPSSLYLSPSTLNSPNPRIPLSAS